MICAVFAIDPAAGDGHFGMVVHIVHKRRNRVWLDLGIRVQDVDEFRRRADFETGMNPEIVACAEPGVPTGLQHLNIKMRGPFHGSGRVDHALE